MSERVLGRDRRASAFVTPFWLLATMVVITCGILILGEVDLL